MQSPQSENRLSVRVCPIRHTLFLIFLYGSLFLPFHDAVAVGCQQHALQLLALAVASPHVLRAVTMRVCTEQSFFLSGFRN